MMDLMGLFRVQIAVAPMAGGASVSIPDALVDTGSEYTWVPRAALTGKRPAAAAAGGGRRDDMDDAIPF
jgi:hypothetical protein